MLNLKVGSICSGMGMHLHKWAKPIWAIECDEAIAHCYIQNHPNSQLILKRAQQVMPDELDDVDCIVATPSCKQASVAQGKNRGETPEDYSVAAAIAHIIERKLPKLFLLENVWQYRNFQSFERIKSTLLRCGYYFRYYNLNADKEGVAQSRKRLYGLGVRGGSFLDPVPLNIRRGWHEVLADMIPILEETQLTKPQIALLEKHPTHLWEARLLRRAGARKQSDRPYRPSEPSFTIKALGRNCSNHWHQADVCIGDKAYALSPRACLRLFGDKETADGIWLPESKPLAMEVVGNGASWVMFQRLIEHIKATT
ncbi:DNA cytosine methyltransferase [aff. Roholtiella sp. LEGE 12411]|uniref:DNA cytosine methyltransferase n=1 Tax=aff. Roholtiella sp. LEGE 12411 TaxID=1828822 RepID=UPI001880FD63|nr:DNA cytosine methyltransferase [aff. Roholtiella sp. LEGE 12411]MBE9037653.1 DNA cytosine methyltransferase [aff. Roholtiella sp. LEGE 12411]